LAEILTAINAAPWIRVLVNTRMGLRVKQIDTNMPRLQWDLESAKGNDQIIF